MSGAGKSHRPQRVIRSTRNPDCPTGEKRGYWTRSDARRALKAVLAKPGMSATLSVYRCSCGLFHLGRRPGELHRDFTPVDERRAA